MPRLVAAVLLGSTMLSGCYMGPVFKLKQKKLSCSEPFHAWGGGLVTHVNQGRGDGDFDYEPLDERIERIEGTYDLRSGAFEWVETFVEGSYVVDNEIDGYGTIWNDGDLDIEYDVVANLSDGREHEYRVREQRLGCDMQRWVDQDIPGQPDPTEVWDGEFTDGGFEYVHRFGLYGEVMEAEGRTESDGSYEERTDHSGGGLSIYWYEEGDGKGTVRRDFEEDAGATLEGHWERNLEGELEVDYDYQPQGGSLERWRYDLDAEGDGGGSVDLGTVTCDLDINNHECELDNCSRASMDGNTCELPVSIPPVDVR